MKKIIVVDDEQEILNILEKFLTKQGFTVKTFNSPLQAINVLKNTDDIDLIITDIMMPQINGLELLKQIREFNKKTPILMITAFDSIDKALEAHKYGANNYIKKPFKSLDFILEKINKELS
jgi:DNA-binding NtrC family response regulator